MRELASKSTFLKVWRESSSIAEAAKKLGLTYSQTAMKAYHMRQNGYYLKRMGKKTPKKLVTKKLPAQFTQRPSDETVSNVELMEGLERLFGAKKQSQLKLHAIFALKTLLLAISAILLIATAIRLEKLL